MLKEVLRSLSDTELNAIGEEVHSVILSVIHGQLAAKIDNGKLDKFTRKELSDAVIDELSRRLLERDRQIA